MGRQWQGWRDWGRAFAAVKTEAGELRRRLVDNGWGRLTPDPD